MHRYILFDLDGTLTDSREGITKSVKYSLEKFHIEVENLDSLEKFIGPPLEDSFMEYYDFDQLRAKQAIKYYREYFKQYGIFENKVYNNVNTLLGKLKKCGFNLMIATSKPTVFAEKILKHFDLYSYFQNVVGSNLNGTRCKKGDVIKYILDEYNIFNTQEVVMVGDRKHDVIGAHENNIDCIGVSYGYGSIEELKSAGATYIVDNVMDIFRQIADR